MSLGTEAGLGLGDIVLDGVPASPPKKEHRSLPLNFRPSLLWPLAKRSPISATAEFLFYVKTLAFRGENIGN